MSSETVTNTNMDAANKRARIDPNAIVPTGNSSRRNPKAPLALAEAHIRSHIASLHPQIASMLETHGFKHIMKLSNLYNKEKQILKMKEENDFYPRSVRFEFKLHMTKAAEQRTDYTTLQEEVNTSLQTMKNTFKQHVITATEIEKRVIEDSLLSDFVTTTRLITQAFNIGSENVENVDTVVATIIENNHETLLQPIQSNLESFKTRYLADHNIASWPNIHIEPAAATQTQAQQQRTSAYFAPREQQPLPAANINNAPSRPTATSTLNATISRTLESVFVTSWNTYLDQIKKNEVSLQMKKLSANHGIEQSTDDANMLLDQEPTANPELVEVLITRKTTEATKQLRSEIADLTNQIKQLKNDKRGRGGASKQKENSHVKKNNTTSKLKPQKDQNKQSASHLDSNKNKNKHSSTNSSKSNRQKIHKEAKTALPQKDKGAVDPGMEGDQEQTTDANKQYLSPSHYTYSICYQTSLWVCSRSVQNHQTECI